MTRKICVITGTRADYGLLRWVMQGVKDALDLELQVVACGMHLSPEFGLTWRIIEEDGFCIDRKVEMLMSSDTPVGISKSMGLGLIGFADAFEQLSPDLLLILGDRFEILAAATAAMVARIPIVHLHGGEATEGLIDEAIRHAVTKMAHYHFVAAEEYRRRVIQLGEDPSRVFTVGGLGLDNLKNIKLLNRQTLEAEIGFRFMPRNLMVTYHPVTLRKKMLQRSSVNYLMRLAFSIILDLYSLCPMQILIAEIIQMVNAFVNCHPHANVYSSLGQLRYLSCMNEVDGLVGNSSSGIIEAPSLRKGTVNIGARQAGRIKASSVIDCLPTSQDITRAIADLYSSKFRENLLTLQNPYGEPGASKKIVAMLGKLNLNVLQKRFYDLA